MAKAMEIEAIIQAANAAPAFINRARA